MKTHPTEIVKNSLKKRYRKEKRFRRLGLMAILSACLFLLLLFADIVHKAMPAFYQYRLDLTLSLPEQFQPESARQYLYTALNNTIIDPSQYNTQADKKAMRQLISRAALYQLDTELKALQLKNPKAQTFRFSALLRDDADIALKTGVSPRLSTRQWEILTLWQQQNLVKAHFNSGFFTENDAKMPEQAGIKGALYGTLLTMLVTLGLAFPIGVLAGVYLEEFARKNRLTDWIETSINNLAAVPSIVFGLLGLSVFIGVFKLPRSAPILGGLVLALMTLPTIIIACRAAIKSVSPALKEAALGLGASKMQTVFGQVLPQAMPGILTGAIIGIAQAIGETAPLLMIGMVAFIADTPSSIFDAATVLPVQIYLWSDSPERLFVAKTAAAILVLLLVLISINALAIYLRKTFEKHKA